MDKGLNAKALRRKVIYFFGLVVFLKIKPFKKI